ncbi:MAG: SAM-dependent methyltransferase [Desulfobacteraceae bacterium IS3]|nr:MAG: SAM-dependent methyltransferase [Desulfobacteraceae bacterium IS3]
MREDYVHGYSERETRRLYDQAGSVQEFIHYDTVFPAGASVLEAGCGVGAQTVTLAAKSPQASITAIDISENSIDKARRLIVEKGFPNVKFRLADIFDLPFEQECFDHVFICYVLEHLAEPEKALQSLYNVLKPGGTVTLIEGDHGSCYFHPETTAALHVWHCLVDVQKGLGGNSLIGRQAFPLLKQAGFRNIRVSPRMIYIDRSKPALMDSFVGKTIIPMVEGVRDRAMETGLTDETSWNRGIRNLYRIAEGADGTFCYTFFKAVGIK